MFRESIFNQQILEKGSSDAGNDDFPDYYNDTRTRLATAQHFDTELDWHEKMS